MKKLTLITGVLSLFVLSSCSHYYYAPNTHNVPVFKEKNEARISGSYSIIHGNSGEVQAAYAPAKNVGILANALWVNPKANTSISDGRGHLYELGAGYFKPFGPHRAVNLFVFELYGVAGLGGCRGYYPNINTNIPSTWDTASTLYYPNNYITTSFVKAYIQPSISLGNDIVDVSFSTKIGVIHYYKISTTLPDSVVQYISTAPSPNNGTLVDDWATLHNNRTSPIIEPALTVRVGYKYVKFQMGYSFSIPTNTFMEKLSNSAMFSIGASINFAPRFKKYGWKLTPKEKKEEGK